MKILKHSLCFMLAMTSWLLLNAQNAQQKGLAIATTAYNASKGFDSAASQITMTLKNKSGQTSTRQFNIKTIERSNDGDQSLIVFNTPKDMRGTATLTYTNKAQADDQWVYLPAVGRTKRIASDNKSGPFMGSELAYEDLSSIILEKYDYKYIRTEGAIEVIERVPKDKKSGYTRQIVWLNTAKNSRIEKVEFYDRKNALLKTWDLSQFKQYGKYWHAHLSTMTNHQTGKSTILQTVTHEVQAGLDSSEFTQNSLKRARG